MGTRRPKDAKPQDGETWKYDGEAVVIEGKIRPGGWVTVQGQRKKLAYRKSSKHKWERQFSPEPEPEEDMPPPGYEPPPPPGPPEAGIPPPPRPRPKPAPPGPKPARLREEPIKMHDQEIHRHVHGKPLSHRIQDLRIKGRHVERVSADDMTYLDETGIHKYDFRLPGAYERSRMLTEFV